MFFFEVCQEMTNYQIREKCDEEVRVSLFEVLKSRLICEELEALLAELFLFLCCLLYCLMCLLSLCHSFYEQGFKLKKESMKIERKENQT